MATAQTIIDRSLRLLCQIPAGADPSSDESADALEALNAMAEGWRNERLMCFALQEEVLTLANADASYTIGTSGDLNTTRPVAIERAWIRSSNVDYPVRMIEEDEYAAISDKTTAGDWPMVALYRPTMASSLATLIVWPVPNATRSMRLVTRVVFSGFAAVGTTVTLPPGWERALAYNLALEIAPEYETRASDEVVRIAMESKAGIKRMNMRPLTGSSDLAALLEQGGRGNVLTGP